MRTLAILAMLLAAQAARADTISPAPDAVSVTLYHDDELSTGDLMDTNNDWIKDRGLALITETREIDLPAGPSQIRFRGVASTIVPQTATVDGLPAGTIERNFDYDLLTPGSLLAKSIGATVHLVRTDPKTGKRSETAAIVRSGPSGAMLEIAGKLEAMHCSGLPEALVFDRIPDGRTDTPTLSVKISAPAAGHYTVKLTYIATGLNWSADYVARLNKDGRTLDLNGWLTLANFGSTGFSHAPIAAVAGKLNTTGQDGPVDADAPNVFPQCWPTNINWGTLKRALMFEGSLQSASPLTAIGQDEVETAIVTAARQLGDYKIYDLPAPTDMPAHETKQVQFLAVRGVPFEKVYRYIDGAGADGTTTLVLKLDNSAAGGLGKPLPAGMIAVNAPGPNGTPIFIGESDTPDTPVGLPVEVVLGRTSAVQVRGVDLAEPRAGERSEPHARETRAYAVSNLGAEPADVELCINIAEVRVKIVAEDQPHLLDHGYTVWRFHLAPGARLSFQVTFERAG